MAALACASAATAAGLVLSACGSTTPHPTATRTATTREAAATVVAGPALEVVTPALSASGLATVINGLYKAHPDLNRYVVQSTTYTPRSRRVVLRACTNGGSAPMAENEQTGRLDACAPMIFYFYNYGVARHVPQAVTVANDIFSYAATVISGPLDTAATLGSILHAWGIKVSSAGTGTTQSKTPASVTKLLDTVDDDILAQGSARVAIVGRESPSHKLAERLVADMAGDSARESISEPGARATIRVTPTAAYLSSGGAGLTKLLGLSSAQARAAGSRWIRVPTGTAEYKDLVAEDTIKALPASILPAASTSVRAQTVYANGRLVRRLIWKVARSSGAGSQRRSI